MSTHASTKIDQKEYLKRYLSGDTNKKKKKKEKKHKRKDAVKVKVIDDDAIASTDIGIDEELLLTGDDAPQIVGTYIEEVPEPAEKKWKSIVIKDEPLDEDVKPIKKPDEDLWGPKESSRRIKDEFSPQRRERKSPTPDISPPRKRSSNKYRCRDEKDHEQCSRKIRSRSRDRKKKKLDDSSPPRRERNSTPTRNSDRDTSPVRNRGKKSKINKSPPNRRRKSNSFDQSPPRRRRNSSSLDQSPPRRRRKSESSDQSPPRRGRKRQSSDESPPRRKTKKLSKSPEKQRNQRIKRESPDQSPLRLKQRHSPNMSPTLRTRKDSPEQSRRRRKSSSDQSPPRRDTDLSPRRMEAPRISPSNIKIERISPVRMRNTSRERDHRTDRNIRGSSQQRSSRWQPREPSRSLSPPPTHMKKATKTLDGKKAGLQDAQTLKLENMERRRKEDDFYANMSTEMSGRDAEVQIRNSGRRGRRAKAAEELDPETQRKKEIREAEKKERYDRWGKGLKQIEEHRAKINEQQYEANKPLARYSNDEDLDRHLRNQERADDPMLEYMREKKKEKQKHENVAIMPTYQGPYPENRFGIRPGYRWDGVDRSNGYEKKWFDVQSEKRAIRDEAYKYSVEDM